MKVVLLGLMSLFVLSACASTGGLRPNPSVQTSKALLRPYQQNLPTLSAGKIERFLISSQLDKTRRKVRDRVIDVWLPPNYPTAGRYAVVYMWDGQMLFDQEQTWNNQEWGVDETAAMLQDASQVSATRPFIVVGIHNAGSDRHNEYFPQDVLMDSKGLRNAFLKQGLYANAFIEFFKQELKPAIDAKFKTYSDAPNTFVIGSSMGGLMSWYTLMRLPELIGGAGCLSTHWPGINPTKGEETFNAIYSYFTKNLPAPNSPAGAKRFWFDFGDKTLDAYYPPLQAKIDEVMQARGYGAHPDLWRTTSDPGAEHNEIAWRKRLPDVLRFLLGAPK
jgi:enterochelin esterase-like enzyme